LIYSEQIDLNDRITFYNAITMQQVKPTKKQFTLDVNATHNTTLPSFFLPRLPTN